MNPNEREQLLIRLISAVMANASPDPTDPTKINLNVSLAMKMVDKVLVEFEILKIRRKQ